MNARLFNLCMALGWAMVTAGAWLLDPWAGLIAGGLLLLALVLKVASLAGVFVPPHKSGGND